MAEAAREIVDQPQMTLQSGHSDEVRSFDTFLLEYPDVLQEALTDEDRQKGVAVVEPVSFEAGNKKAEAEYRRQVAAGVISDLLTTSRYGRNLDFDGGTWTAILADQEYQKLADKVRAADPEAADIATTHRAAALARLGIYAMRRFTYEQQVGATVTLLPTDFDQIGGSARRTA